jgi:T4 RnlA family RNA ligase
MLLVQEYLQTHSFHDLKKDHEVNFSLSKSKKLASFNYDQLGAKESNLLAQQCRGLILANQNYEEIQDTIIDSVIVACPMFRFFNYSQGCAAQINWSDKNLKIMEKMDGTLCISYFNKFEGTWNIATRSVPQADIMLNNQLYTFRTLFDKTLKETYNVSMEEFTKDFNINYTYCFELTTPLNEVVIKYADFKLTLLAIRDNISLEEIFDLQSHASYMHGVQVAQSYPFSSVPNLIDWVTSRNFKENEGVVVVDSQFNRIKIKDPGYVLASHMKESLSTSPRNCLEIILLGKEDDVVSLLHKDIVDNLYLIKNKLAAMIKNYDELFLEIKSQVIDPSKKSFALVVNKVCAEKKLWDTPFFIMNSKEMDMKQFLMSNQTQNGFNSSFLQKILNIINI